MQFSYLRKFSTSDPPEEPYPVPRSRICPQNDNSGPLAPTARKPSIPAGERDRKNENLQNEPNPKNGRPAGEIKVIPNPLAPYASNGGHFVDPALIGGFGGVGIFVGQA